LLSKSGRREDSPLRTLVEVRSGSDEEEEEEEEG